MKAATKRLHAVLHICICMCFVVHAGVRLDLMCGCVLFLSDMEGICSETQNQEGKRRGNDVYWNGKDKVCGYILCTIDIYFMYDRHSYNSVCMYPAGGGGMRERKKRERESKT